MEIIFLVGGLAGGFLIGYFLSALLSSKKINGIQQEKMLSELETSNIKTTLNHFEKQLRESIEELKTLEQKNLELEKNCAALSTQNQVYLNQSNEILSERQKYIELSKNHSALQSDFENLKSRMEEEKLQIEGLQKKFSDSFENLANQILEQKTKKFTDLNKCQLEEVLNPLREKMNEFREKVEKTHSEGLVKNAALSEKLDIMNNMAKELKLEAESLTKALKGENKTQGNWGEMILERILETSGLKKDVHYISQGKNLGLKDEEGSSQKPDIIINLPDKKHLIIDAKVSLIAYEEWVNADSDLKKQEAASNLLQSLTAHINNLSSKNYQKNPDLNSPDFVFLFMPIEPVLGIVLNENKQILDYAWKKKVMIVTPTTLTATLWTISNIWVQENQIQNIHEVFKVVTEIHDKVVLFLESFEDVGKSLDKAKEHYEETIKRAKTGQGNFMQKFNKLKGMGVSSPKSIPKILTNFENSDV